MNVFEQEGTTGKQTLQFIWNHRVALLIAVLVAGIAAATATYFMEPEYRSTGIIFPTNSNKLESVLANPQFGFDLDADRLMQILESRQVRDAVISKFKLEQYYDLDTTERDWRGKLTLKFIEDITFFRSKYMSIVISAQTTSPQLSADIVNYVVDTLDVIRENIFKENLMMHYNAVKADFEENERMVISLNDTLTELFHQDAAYQQLYYQFRLGDWTKGLEIPEEKLARLDPESERLITTYVYEVERLSKSKQYLDEVADKIEKPFPKVYEIDRAVPSYYKEFPSYKMNIGIACSAAMLLTLVVLYFKEEFRTS